MPRDRDRVRLLHMLEHSREAIQLVSGKTRQDLDADRVLSLAVVRLLEIVGLRNRLIHGYDSVDLDIVWSIVKGDLPALVRDLNAGPDLQNDQ